LGVGPWGWGLGAWPPTPTPQSPIPNPQKERFINNLLYLIIKLIIFELYNYIININ